MKNEVLIGGKMAEQLREDNPLEFDVVLPVDVVAASVFEPDAGGGEPACKLRFTSIFAIFGAGVLSFA